MEIDDDDDEEGLFDDIEWTSIHWQWIEKENWRTGVRERERTREEKVH